jgi:hypothetical protein
VAAAYFADTSFWIALASQRDQLHGFAVAWSRHLLESRAALLTTEAVLWEWMNAMAEPATRGVAAEGYQRCHRDPQIEVVPFSIGLSSPPSGCTLAEPTKAGA